MGNTWRQPETRIDKKGDKGRQDFGKADAPSNTGAHMRGDNGRECGAMGDQGRQDLEKAGTPLKQGNDGRRQGETRPCEGGHTIQHKRILWGDSGRQWQTTERPEKADIPSQAHMWRDNRRQKGKTTRWEGRPTIQHRQTCGETMRDNALNGTEGVRRGDETLGRRTRHPTQAHMWGDNERQDVRKADAPSNTDTHAGRQWETLGDKGETRHRECKHIIQHRHTCGDETTGEKWRQGTGTADTPTNKKETRRETLGRRQRETRPRRTP